MEQIGAKLRERRLELGFSLEEVSKKTRLQVPYLKAIEAGNIDFFKDDLSYLTYYVRHYATEIGVDYDSMKSMVDDTIYDYTESLNVGEVRRNLELSDRIKKQSEHSKAKQNQNQNKPRTTRVRRKIDFSMVAFILSAIAFMIVIIVVLFHYVPIWLNDEPLPNPPNGAVDPNVPDDPVDPDDDVVDPVPTEITVTQENDTTFVVSGWTEDQSIEIALNIKNRTWLRITVDDVDVDNPVSKIYESGETVHLSQSALEGKEIMFHIGYVNGNTFTVNEKSIELAPSVANLQGSAKIYFKFVNSGGSE